jgi:hypothetical protein
VRGVFPLILQNKFRKKYQPLNNTIEATYFNKGRYTE